MIDYRSLYPDLFRPMPGEFEVMADNRKTYRVHAPSPGDACVRVADLYGVAVIAWRHPRVMLVPGVSRDAREIIP